MAEWLRSGLQIRVPQFDSGRGLQFIGFVLSQSQMPLNNNQSQTVGAILAGGTAQRLGRALKSGIKVNGTDLLTRVSQIITKDCAHLLLSIGTHDPDLFPQYNSSALVTDNGQGPAAALSQIVDFIIKNHPEAEYLLLAAVDTPFLPTDFAQRAHSLLSPQTDAVIGAYKGQSYPTNALWRLSSLKDLPERFADGTATRSLFGLLDQKKWCVLDYENIQTDNPFANINTPGDLIACNRRDLK